MPVCFVHLFEGRTVDQKRKLVRAITDAMVNFADCKPDGSFEALGIPPGDYSAAAFPVAINLTDLRDPGILAKVISAGTSVSVAQSPVTVQLKVIPFPE